MSISDVCKVREAYINGCFEDAIENSTTQFTTSTDKQVVLKGRKALQDLDIYIKTLQIAGGTEEEIQQADGSFVVLTLDELLEVAGQAVVYGGNLARRRVVKIKALRLASTDTYSGGAEEVEAQAMSVMMLVDWDN